MPPASQKERKASSRHAPANLYDAVAGRVGYEGFLTHKRPSKHRDTASNSTTAVPPEEVLFRRRGAPARYAEDDIYDADRYRTPEQRLPESDLLKAIHSYASDFYGSMGNAKDDPNRGSDFHSLDETALLAMGILIEEAARDVLGETGDLALYKSADTEVSGPKATIHEPRREPA